MSRIALMGAGAAIARLLIAEMDKTGVQVVDGQDAVAIEVWPQAFTFNNPIMVEARATGPAPRHNDRAYLKRKKGRA